MIETKVFPINNLQLISVGQVQIVSTEVPIRGWDSLTNIGISQLSSSPDVFLDVQFRYSINAIHFTEWQYFQVVPNIPIKNDFIVEIKLELKGVPDSGSISVNAFTLEGMFNQLYADFYSLPDTIFEGIKWSDVRWNKLWINLLRKIYYEGIVPKFIDRNLGTSIDDILDKDYLDYWKTICWFWAYIIELGFRKIENIRLYDNDLKDYLTQKTALFCDETPLEVLDYLMVDFFNQVRHRGTHLIHLKKGEQGLIQDGELLRYICYQDCDEFLLEYLPRFLSGWTLDRSSPNFSGNTGHLQLNKAPNKELNESLEYYQLLNSQNIELIIDDGLMEILTEDGEPLLSESDEILIIQGFDMVRDVIHLGSSSGFVDLLLTEENNTLPYPTPPNQPISTENSFDIELGYGDNSNLYPVNSGGLSFKTCINPKIGYEFTFYVRSDTPMLDNFTVLVNVFDKDGNKLQTRKMNGDLITLPNQGNVILTNTKLPRKDRYYLVRTMIYPLDAITDVNGYFKTNIEQGLDIKFEDVSSKEVEFVILKDDLNSDIFLWNIKVTPILLQKSSVFLDAYNVCNNIIDNKNETENQRDLEENISKYLLPYGTIYQPLYLNEL